MSHGDSYFSDWRTRNYRCSGCGWTGTGDDTAKDIFSDLFEIHCPRCDLKFARIGFPVDSEIRTAAKEGNAEALGMMPGLEDGERVREHLRECRARLARLPALPGDQLTFRLTAEDIGDSLNPQWIILIHEDTEIYREPSGFEWWQGVIEIGEAIVEQYGARIAWYDPSEAGIAVLGDNISADDKIQKFLDSNDLTPPTGPWSHAADR